MKRTIGIFDSGIGGLTVVKEICNQLPYENILYFGDTARIPYGNKTPEQMADIVREIIDWMLGYQVKAVLMACNTSSAIALDVVRDEYNIPIFGLINPASEYICSLGERVKKIGIIATEATVKSGAYAKAIQQKRPDIDVTQIACPGLVEIIESGQVNAPVAYKTVEKFISPLLQKNVDKIVLGCTHYPYVADVICNISGRNDILINPAEFMVNEVKSFLSVNNCMRIINPNVERNYYVSAAPAQFISSGSKLLPSMLSNDNVKLVNITEFEEQAIVLDINANTPAFKQA